MSHETSTDYRNPFRPAPLRFANRLLGPVLTGGPLKVSLEPASLIRAASKKTGLEDRSDTDAREALARLTQSIDDEANLNAIGRLITRARLTGTLATRQRLDALIEKHPEIEERPIHRPIVILGLPRTGTTLLHRLLASDESRIRSLKSWEALAPVPGGNVADPYPRVQAADRSEKALKYMAPDFFAVHPIDARGPEEEILLLDLAFRSTVPEATMRVPSYATWLEGTDNSPAYRAMARALRALQWQRSPAGDEWRWVLKTPHHMEWVLEIPKVLENPIFVWTHRDPSEVVGSFCSMIAHGRGVFSDDVDPFEIGQFWLRKGRRMVERAMAAREVIGKDSFIDVSYKALIKDPLKVVREVEERAGLGWSDRVETNLRDAMAREKKDRHGVHRYDLSYFGLTPGDIDREFADYKAMLRT